VYKRQTVAVIGPCPSEEQDVEKVLRWLPEFAERLGISSAYSAHLVETRRNAWRAAFGNLSFLAGKPFFR
jgi:hypothetical protein